MTAPRVVTAREAAVLDGMCEGLTNRAIGNRLYVSEDTVKNDVKKLFRALGARNRSHAVALVLTKQITVLVEEA